MHNFETIIGLEIHTELRTKTKMFSPALNSFGHTPNTTVNEIDLGYPGGLPSVNKKGVELGIKICSILEMRIDDLLRFDRKNYFYADLSKGYQITQQYYPLGTNGKLDIQVNDQIKTIRINRLHLEEDTAKQLHLGEKTLIDYNRAGSPLAEIVTEADIRSADEAVAYLQKMREILLYSGVSDAKMEEGSLRCDVNISIRPYGSKKFGNKVEVKNLNSISNVYKAIKFEEARQRKLYLLNEDIQQATRRWDEATSTTILMRLKDDAVDYRYTPDPDIAPIRLSHKWIETIKKNIPELPEAKVKRYMKMGLDEMKAMQVIGNYDLAMFLDELLTHYKNISEAHNWVFGALSAHINSHGSHHLSPSRLADMLNHLDNGDINSTQAKKIFAHLLHTDGEIKQLVIDLGLVQISDPNVLIPIINNVIDKMAHMLKQYNDRPERVEKTFMGLVMKETRGQADPVVAMKLIKMEINKRL